MKKYLFIVLLVGVCFGQNRSALVDTSVDDVIDILNPHIEKFYDTKRRSLKKYHLFK